MALITLVPSTSFASISIFDCQFPKDSFEFVVTVFDDGRRTRIGIETGIGNQADAFFDRVTGSNIFVEFIGNGSLPSTLTTVLSNGTAFHSRHSLSIDGSVLASQMIGKCAVREVN